MEVNPPLHIRGVLLWTTSIAVYDVALGVDE
jgi:hypothetical protein